MRTEDALLVSEARTAVRDRRLGALLHESGLRQADLALVLGVTQATVSRWSAGLRAPERETAIRLAKFMRALETTGATNAEP
jgi:transcriptional regulator with XRE-family HTH domain